VLTVSEYLLEFETQRGLGPGSGKQDCSGLGNGGDGTRVRKFRNLKDSEDYINRRKKVRKVDE
jgi:hypothetical protein